MAGEEQATQTVYVVLHREEPIKLFHGSNHPGDVESFIEDIRGAWRARRVTENEEKRDVLWAHLGESVRAECRCHPPEVRSNPEELIRVLQSVYGEKRSISKLMGLFLTVHQHVSETVRAYSHRLQAAFDALLARQTCLSVALTDAVILRDHFAENLLDPLLRKYLREETHKYPRTSFLDLRDTAIRWSEEECYDHSMHSVATTVEPKQPGPELEKLVLALAKQVGELSTTIEYLQLAQQSPDAHPYPQRSGEPDHYGYHSGYCDNCGSPDHLAGECLKGRQSTVGANGTIHHKDEDSTLSSQIIGTRPAANVSLNGLCCEATIDTGSLVSTVTESLFTNQTASVLPEVGDTQTVRPQSVMFKVVVPTGPVVNKGMVQAAPLHCLKVVKETVSVDPMIVNVRSVCQTRRQAVPGEDSALFSLHFCLLFICNHFLSFFYVFMKMIYLLFVCLYYPFYDMLTLLCSVHRFFLFGVLGRYVYLIVTLMSDVLRIGTAFFVPVRLSQFPPIFRLHAFYVCPNG